MLQVSPLRKGILSSEFFLRVAEIGAKAILH